MEPTKDEIILGYRKARALLAGGPYDVYDISSAGAARRELLGESYGLLFPDEPKLCLTCPGKMLQAFREVKAAAFELVKYDIPEEETPARLDQPNPTPPARNKTMFRFKDPKTTYREHGSPTTYTAANLTDAVAKRIIKGDPEARELFEEIDDAEAAAAAPVREETLEELEARVAAMKAAKGGNAGSTTQAPAGATGTDADEDGDDDGGENPLSLEQKIDGARKLLKSKKREELDGLFTALMPDAGDPSQFANKDELVDALIAYQFREELAAKPEGAGE